MSKGQHGNKEAKKPKKAPEPRAPQAPGTATPTETPVAPARPRK